MSETAKSMSDAPPPEAVADIVRVSAEAIALHTNQSGLMFELKTNLATA